MATRGTKPWTSDDSWSWPSDRGRTTPPGWATAYDPRETAKWLLALFVAKGLVFAILLVWGPEIQNFIFEAFERRWPPEGHKVFLSRLGTWDAAHYLHLAEHGYKAGDPSCAFYPLWPAILRATGVAGTSWASAGACVLAFLAWASATWLLHGMLVPVLGRGGSRAVILIHNLVPSSIFFWLGYTESLFLLLAVVFFRGCGSRHWPTAALGAFLLPWCRPVGIFCLFPAFCVAWNRRADPRWWLPVAATLAGFGTYLAFMYASTGNPWEGFAAQKAYTNSPSLLHLLRPWELLTRLPDIRDWHNPTNSLLDRVLFVLCLGFLVRLRRIDGVLFAWSLPMLMVPAISNWYLSFGRFTTVVWPVWVAALAVADTMPRRAKYAYAGLCCVAQSLLWARYFAFAWAN